MTNNKKAKIRVNELVAKYNLKRTDEEKVEYLRNVIEIKDRQNYSSIVALANMIVERSCMDKSGNVNVDSCMRYMMYVYTVIDTYTNVILEPSNWSYEFDQLDKYGLVDMLLSMIPESELNRLKRTVDLRMNDFMINHNNVLNFINEKFEELKPFIGENLNQFIAYASQVVQETMEK